MLSQRDALDLALSIWNGPRREDQKRLDAIHAALNPPNATERVETRRLYGREWAVGGYEPNVVIPADAPPIMHELARKSRTNYLPLLVRVFRQALRVDGYLSHADPEANPWMWWQRNRMDARQVGIHDSALKYGAAYARVYPGDAGPSVRVFSPRKMTAVYRDPEVDDWPEFTLHIEDNTHLVLTDADAEYRFGIEDALARDQLAAGGEVAADVALSRGHVEYIEPKAHDTGYVPIVRYRDECLVDGEETFGIIEPLIVVQDRIDETSFGQLVAQYFAAFKQRAVLGWIPSDEAEELRAGAARIWYLDVDPSQVRIEELTETDLTRYIDSGKSARRDFAAIAQIPAGDLGVDSISNISDATLAGLDKAKNERAGEIALALGESHEQLMRLMAASAARDVTLPVEQRAAWEASAVEWSSEIRWAEREARTWAGQIDGLVKLVQSQILTQDTAVEMVPGLTDQQVESARADARKARAAQAVTALTQAAATRQARSAPTVAGTAAPAE